MLLLLLIAVLFVTGAVSDDRTIPAECNPRLLHHYNELGCTPVFGTGPCPTKYNCPEFQSRSKDKCYVAGNEYERNAQIGSFYRGCSASCYCGNQLDSAKVTCAQVECAELFNPTHMKPGCISQYSIDSCCFESQFCPNETKPTTDIVCQYNGSTLIQGQKFYPTEEPCKVCVCKAGFDGTLKEPWCENIFCSTELHHDVDLRNGCVPVYRNGSCCPWEYSCPDADDQARVISPEGDAARTSDDKCVYGSMQMNVGDSLELSDRCLACTCSTPPMVTCQKTCDNN